MFFDTSEILVIRTYYERITNVSEAENPGRIRGLFASGHFVDVNKTFLNLFRSTWNNFLQKLYILLNFRKIFARFYEFSSRG